MNNLSLAFECRKHLKGADADNLQSDERENSDEETLFAFKKRYLLLIRASYIILAFYTIQFVSNGLVLMFEVAIL